MVGTGFVLVTALHLLAGWRERRLDRGTAATRKGWLVVGPPKSIPDKGARIVVAAGGERIAVFRDGRQIGAVSNLCAHQNGPLGEGRIVDGSITNLTILNSSGIPPYDFAAKKAIELSSPLNPLPKDFPNPSERVTCMFFYNQEPPTR